MTLARESADMVAATRERSPGAGPLVDACDHCLALSHLTSVLAKVPRLRGIDPDPSPAKPEDADHEPRPAPEPILPPLVADGSNLAPLPGELVRAAYGVTADRAEHLRTELRSWSADAVRIACLEAGLRAICRCHREYPPCVACLSDDPPVLYVRGDARLLERCSDGAIGMVGTRRPTLVGRDAARRIAAGIARSGGVVVSGMALGIDGASHEGALSVSGATIAVLASGADRPSPRTHRRLYDQILDHGLVVSEMPPGAEPYRWSFPARNRIIAGLSRATVVVEAPLRSGALITVEQAQDLGRDVFAVPGCLASVTCEGSNRLLCEGGGAVIDGAYFAAQLGMAGEVAMAAPREGPLAELHATLARGPLSLDELARRATSLGPGEVELALLDLELAGWVARRPDGRYRVVDRWSA